MTDSNDFCTCLSDAVSKALQLFYNNLTLKFLKILSILIQIIDVT